MSTAAVVVLNALSLLAPAQEPDAPVFDATTQLVLVDLMVTDKDQRPVLKLTAPDFRVFEDGVERDIVSFAAFGPVPVPAAAPSPAPDVPAAPPEPPAVRFVPAATALVIDEGHLSPADAARLGPALTEVLRGLGERRGSLLVLAPWSNIAFAGRLPEDAASLAYAAGQIRGRRFPQISKFPMTDAEALAIENHDTLTEKRVLERFRFLTPGLEREMVALVRTRATELADAARGRRRDTFEAVRIATEWLGKQPGRHTLLLLSPGFANDPADRGFRQLVNESLRVNAPIHFLDVRALGASTTFEGIEYGHALPMGARVSPFEPREAAAGSDQLAASTGGLRAGLNDLSSGLARILDATRSYYVIGYEPVPRKKRGFRKIKVEVKGKGLRVLARRGYFDEGSARPADP